MSWQLQGLLRDPGLPLVTGCTPHCNVGKGSFILAFHSICKEFHPSSPFSKRNEQLVWQITVSVDVPLARCLCRPTGICAANLSCYITPVTVLQAQSGAFHADQHMDKHTGGGGGNKGFWQQHSHTWRKSREWGTGEEEEDAAIRAMGEGAERRGEDKGKHYTKQNVAQETESSFKKWDKVTGEQRQML